MVQPRGIRRPSFLDKSLRLNGITAILDSVIEQPEYFSRVFILSNIKFKKSFLKYLNYCKTQGFVIGTPGISHGRSRAENQHVVYYSITQKGRDFLEMLQ